MRVLLRLGLLSCGGLATAALPHASTTLAAFVPGGNWTPLATGIGIAESGLAPAIQVTVSHTDLTSRGTRYFFRLRIGP